MICLAACCLLSQHPFRVPPAFPPISLVYLSTMTYSWHSLEAFRNHSKFVKNEKTNFSAECILISCAPVEFFSFSSQKERDRGECENQNVCACVCVCVLKRFAFHCNTPEMATLTNSNNNKNNRNRKMLLLPLGFPPLGNAGQIESTSTFLYPLPSPSALFSLHSSRCLLANIHFLLVSAHSLADFSASASASFNAQNNGILNVTNRYMSPT